MQELQRKQNQINLIREATGQKQASVEDNIKKLRSIHFTEHKEFIFAEQFTTLHKAAYDGSLNGIIHFLKAKGSTVNRAPTVNDLDKYGKCPIHYAVERGNVDAINYLIQKGCSVNILTTEGNTSMMIACHENQLESIRCLFANGADTTLKNRCSATAIHFACQQDHEEAVKLIINLIIELKIKLINDKLEKDKERGRVDSTVFVAEDNSVNESQKKLIQEREIFMQKFQEHIFAMPENFLLEIPDVSGLRPIHVAAMHGSQRCLAYLVQRGADIHARDVMGETALHKCARKSYFASYKLLKDAGCSDLTRSKLKETPAGLLHDEIREFY